MAKMQYCAFCGAEAGIFVAYYRDIISCGSSECERYARDEERGERERAAYDAEQDDYERYRR